MTRQNALEVIRVNGHAVPPLADITAQRGDKWGVAYLRISSDPEDQRAGVERQRKDVIKMAKDRELGLLLVFEDNSVSGWSKRPKDAQWWRLLATLDSHRPPFLLAYDTDRLSRDDIELLSLARKCNDIGTVGITQNLGYDTFNSEAFGFMAVFAKRRSDQGQRNVLKAKDSERQERGFNRGGVRLYGYESDRTTIIEPEARVVREVADRLIAGESRNAVGRELDRRKTPTAHETQWVERIDRRRAEGRSVEDIAAELQRRWRVPTETIAKACDLLGKGTPHRKVARSLHPMTAQSSWEHNPQLVCQTATNPRYIGEVWFNGALISKGKIPPILSEDVYRKVLSAVESTKGNRNGRPAQSLLGGIARCAVCRAPMYAMVAGRSELIYRCVDGGKGHVSRSRKLVDDYVTAQVLAKVADRHIEAEYDKLSAEVNEASKRSLDLFAQIGDVGARQHEVETGFAANEIPYPQYQSTLNKLADRERKLTKDMVKADAQVRELLHQQNKLTEGVRAQSEWSTWSIEDKRELIRSLIVDGDCLYVHKAELGFAARTIQPGDVEILWR